MMDWPLTAALGALAAAVGVVSFGVVTALQSDSPPTKRPVVASVSVPAPKPMPKPTPKPAVQSVSLLPALVPLSAPALAPASVPEVVSPSVVVLAPAYRPLEHPVPDHPVAAPARPHTLALPRLNDEPPPKAARPVARPAPAHPFSAPPPPRETRIPGVMTGSEIGRIRAALRLTAEQLPLWRPVEAVLRDIGRQQLAQIRNGDKPDVNMSAMTRVYYAAQSLLGTLRPDQKEQVRRLARSMGYASVASML